MNYSRGFSFIELLVVMGIIALLSSALVLSVRSSGNTSALNQAGSVVGSDIRRMQSMALAGSSFQGSAMCGFGVHYVDDSTYLLFARSAPVSGTCASDVRPKTYEPGDVVVEQRRLSTTRIMVREAFPDVFYELPNPTTYLDGDASSNQVEIALVSRDDPTGTAVTVTVFTSGKIDVQ